MNRLFAFFAFVIPTFLSACAPLQQSQATSQRLVALGDLHGDLDAARRALRLAGAIDAQDHWIGGSLVVVQTGDQLDRGDQELELLDFLDQVATEAEKAGGKMHLLNGNHEIMNVQGDFRYVSPAGFQSFDKLKLPEPPSARALLSKVPAFAKQRAIAFLPGGPYSLRLATRKSVLLLGDTVFVHGGVSPQHVDYGIDKLNGDYQNWLKGTVPNLPALLTNDQSPIWSRVYSDPGLTPDCTQLKQTLDKLGLKRMVVGHSVHPKVNSACEGQIWRIDVGMARAYGGPVQVLELSGHEPKVLEEKTPAQNGASSAP
ncbi:MAG: metallophosphoesterase [Candidatus Sericytochromatia bacterium]|nr:metallophosphoesterase [Candidatus Sericytochromatia bacterium]